LFNPTLPQGKLQAMKDLIDSTLSQSERQGIKDLIDTKVFESNRQDITDSTGIKVSKVPLRPELLQSIKELNLTELEQIRDLIDKPELQQGIKIIFDTEEALNAGSNKLEESKQSDKLLKVTIFGGNHCKTGDDLWKFSEELGHKLAVNGFHVITGGYYGSMEAISAAAKIKNARVEGVICPPLFPSYGNSGNKHLSIITRTNTLFQRLQVLYDKADYIVVLPGQIETIMELSTCWSHTLVKEDPNVLRREDSKRHPPIFVVRKPWQAVLQTLATALQFAAADLNKLTFFDTVDELISKLNQIQAK